MVPATTIAMIDPVASVAAVLLLPEDAVWDGDVDTCVCEAEADTTCVCRGWLARNMDRN